MTDYDDRDDWEDEWEDARTPLTKAAEEIIDEETTAIDLLEQLDVSRYRRDDKKAGTDRAEDFDPMFKAVLYREIEDLSDKELRRHLDDPETAEALGFETGAVPHRTTFYRARTDRFEPLERTIRIARRQIRRMAIECGSPIGPALTPDDKDGVSKRTEERLIRGKTKEMIDRMEWLVYPAFDLPRPDEAIYDGEELLKMETVMGIKQSAANDGGVTYGDLLAEEKDIDVDDPFYEDGPTGETLLEDIKQMEPETISEMVNWALARIFPRIKPYEEFPEPVMVAVDVTYVAYYGDRDELVRVTGAPKDKEYDWCHKFATANIVGDAVRLPVAMLPVGEAHHHDTDAYPGEDKSYRPGNVVRNLLDIATDHVKVRCVLADREFYAADVITALEEHRLRYVIPVPEDDRIGRFADSIDKVTVRDEYALYGPTRGGVTNDRVVTTLVGLPPDDAYDDEQVFATNLDVDDEIGIDRRSTKRRINRYQRRGGIETSYKKIKEFAAWTTSKEFPVRLFHFGFAVILYAMWLLVDFLVQTSLDVVEYRVKPRVTAQRFRNLLDGRLVRLI